jgi:tRNA(Ile)-lysidine synthase
MDSEARRGVRDDHDLNDRVLRALRDGLPERLVVGVSGGMDSVALLHGLVKVGREPVVVHFNHGWRVAGDEDEAFCKDLAGSYGLSFYVEKAAEKDRVAKEDVARRARFRFFRKVCDDVGVRDLVLGHHADDVVETYLMQLFRGAGVGARGIISPVVRDGMQMWRPWIGVWREEVEKFAKAEGLVWRDDGSNRDRRYRRNWIRHELIPLLEREGFLGVKRALWRSARVMADRGEWIEEWVRKWWEMETLSVKELNSWPVGMQREVVYGWLKRRGVKDVSFEDVEGVRGLLIKMKPARANVAGGKQVYRRGGVIGVRGQGG